VGKQASDRTDTPTPDGGRPTQADGPTPAWRSHSSRHCATCSLVEAELLLRAVLDKAGDYAHRHLRDNDDPDCPSCDAERWLARRRE
jgi:hypothetical protein